MSFHSTRRWTHGIKLTDDERVATTQNLELFESLPEVHLWATSNRMLRVTRPTFATMNPTPYMCVDRLRILVSDLTARASNPVKRYGYARVSTDDQSLDVQITALNAAGCSVILSEKASGASRDGRAKLALVLEVIGQGDTLIVTKLDRLARDTVDMLELVREIGDKGAGFRSLAESWADTTTPAGELVLTIMAGVAQFERARIRERQREGIEAAKRNGVYKGGKKRFADADIWALDAQGLGATEIMRKIGARSTSTVYRALERRPRPAIHVARACGM
jgi:DNA invertase Pin-like site-specific DNA recombinase